ncbi:SDR family oxidoreductase [Alkalicoccobacillus murimartini]|uniref:NAD(P)H dehydrogenase (Quinone) n=1 Tax=Alkalicoccobacillus murimartini TaxID=171685 RepID=A0ABT9YH87_9BACI|nr:SDR family oxidoreductase [Alkalicoccobacillus murimartini]MDQ0207232.1 NAD(P)H dehydrogenase (quinone) [Alkalicoccobacillus murimartini]
MKTLITGATGKLGSKVVTSVLKVIPATELAVSVRDPKKAAELKELGVDVRQADFDHPESLDKAFSDIDRLLLISADGDNETRIQQHTNAVEAAERAGVTFIAYTSLADATHSKNLMAAPHVATEAAIKKTGIPYSFLRNNWYLENELGSIQGVVAGAPWVTSAESSKVGWALQQDYADAAANVLTQDGHDNTTYELSGPLLTQEEFVTQLGSVLNKDITLNQVNDEDYAETMKQAGVPDFAIPIVVGIQQSIRVGSLAIESDDFEKVLGRPVTPMKEALKQLV